MLHTRKWQSATLRTVRVAALAAVATLAFGSLAWAHDGDDYRYRGDEVREHGYRNGYQDGVRHGRYDRMQGRRYNYKSDQWEDADSGYEHWMGSRGQYKKAYRSGYVNGYREGYGDYRRDRDGDRDDRRWRDHDEYR